MNRIQLCLLTSLTALFSITSVRADVGDPQIRTDHPWYPGELACSTFERLFATQADIYKRVVGVEPKTDEQKALASWLWRNTHYWHGEEGAEDLWGKGFTSGGDMRTREYWTGLFAHGFGLCGTTHSQWVAEMNALLGHNRGRGVGVAGHNSFEAFLTGGPYGNGKWALLDHDLSTVIFNDEGTALLSIPEVQADVKLLTDRKFAPQKQQGWLVCGLHPDDGSVYSGYQTAEYLAGYSGVPPMVHLRRGETFRRYLQPGLADEKTFVFWGRNYKTGSIPGPERSISWVGQPDKMRGSINGAGYKPGQARYANAVYTYKPDFTSDDYREGVIEEDENHIVFEFTTPYIIGATPPNDKSWGIYDTGGRNGLVLHGKANAPVAISTDDGRTWNQCGALSDGLDLTDQVKGRRQYLLRFGASAKALKESGLTITTVCQANAWIMPQLKDGANQISFLASGEAVISAGPNRENARTHVVSGAFDTPAVTMELATPRGEGATRVYAAAHIASGSPPQPDIKYQVEYSLDAGKTWKPMVQDWTIPRRGQEPDDFWSQSFCWGSAQVQDAISKEAASKVQVRFRNNGGRKYLRCEVHVTYRTQGKDATKVTFNWADDAGTHQDSHLFSGEGTPTPWNLQAGRNVQTRWIEFEPVK